MLDPDLKQRMIDEIALDPEKGITGRDFKRLLLSQKLSNPDGASILFCDPSVVSRVVGESEHVLRDTDLENYVAPLYEKASEPVILPVPISDNIPRNPNVTFKGCDFHELSNFLQLEQQQLATFLDLDVRYTVGLFQDTRHLMKVGSINDIGKIFHLLHYFKSSGKTLAHQEVSSFRKSIIENDHDDLNKLYIYYELPDWRICLNNKGISNRPEITSREVVLCRLSNGLSSTEFSKYISSCISKNYHRNNVSKLEAGFDSGSVIDLEKTSYGYYLSDIITNIYQNTPVFNIPICGKPKKGRYQTYTVPELNSLLDYFKIDLVKFSELSGASLDAIKKSISSDTPTFSPNIVKTIATLDCLQKSITKQRSAHRREEQFLTTSSYKKDGTPKMTFKAPVKRHLNSIRDTIIGSVKECQTPQDLSSMIIEWANLYPQDDGYPALSLYTLQSLRPEQQPEPTLFSEKMCFEAEKLWEELNGSTR